MSINISEYGDDDCNFSEQIYHDQQQNQQACLDLIKMSMLKTANKEDVQIQSKQKESISKTKSIKKRSDIYSRQDKSEKKKNHKRVKDPQIKTEKGRPNNMSVQIMHLTQNKKHNDIVYHYARFLIFLKFNQGREIHNEQIQFPSHIADQIDEATHIMNRNNYPLYQQEKPVFLLHPNSPHFVFSIFQLQKIKKGYTSAQILAIILAFLNKKKLLSLNNYNYINDYWPDIIYLFNNPKGSNYDGNIPQDSQENSAYSQPFQNESEEQNNNKISNKNNHDNKNDQKAKKANNNDTKKSSKNDNPNSEYKLLQIQLKNDPTIIAYEIACYLHACSEKYRFKIYQ